MASSTSEFQSDSRIMSNKNASPHFQVIFAPNPFIAIPPTASSAELTAPVSIFLSGSIAHSKSDWRNHLTERLSHLPVTILNPHRHDWDSSWKQDVSCVPLRDQIIWELDGMERADIVAMYLDPATEAPVTLVELGLCAGKRPKQTICACPEGYFRRANVQVVCARHGVELVEGLNELVRKVEERAEIILSRIKEGAFDSDGA